MFASLNGQIVPEHEAQVAAMDAGLQHAVGLFETMHARAGRVFRLDGHLARLRRSAGELGLALLPDDATLAEAVQQAVDANAASSGPLPQARVRLTVTPGSVSLLQRGDDSDASDGGESQDDTGLMNSAPAPTVLVTVSEPIRYDPGYFENGITVSIAGPMANPFDPIAGHKTLAYWGRLRSLRQAASLGAGETIWLDTHNRLASGAVSNVFLVKGDTLLTPIARGEEEQGALPAPVLPGITRQAVLEIAQGEHRDTLGDAASALPSLTIERRMLDINDLLDADEVFLTNSGWHLLPVTTIEKHTVGEGNVGPVATAMRAGLLRLIEVETRR